MPPYHLAGQFCVRQPLARNLRKSEREAIGVCKRIIAGRTIVVPVDLFDYIAVKVERFHGKVRAAQLAFQQAPKVAPCKWFTVSWTNSRAARFT